MLSFRTNGVLMEELRVRGSLETKRWDMEVGQCGEEGIKLGVPVRYSLVGCYFRRGMGKGQFVHLGTINQTGWGRGI